VEATSSPTAWERISERYILLDANVSPSDTFPEAGARRVIRSFKGKVAEKVFSGKCPKGFPADLLRVSRRKLEAVNAAVQLEDLRVPPGNYLEALVGDRRGQYSIPINDQFRVCFRRKDGGAEDVEIVDYH
jgi:toxin HigB-1